MISQTYNFFERKGRAIFYSIDSSVNQVFSERFNVFYFLGTIPILLLFILLFTGLYLFIYYSLAVESAYNAVKYITESAPLGWLIRSVHRYSADAMMFFVILHMVRIFFEGKYQNHRWLAWVSGIILLLLTLVEGVVGYMMTLDSTAHFLLHKTSSLFSSIGIFDSALSRTFALESLMGKWIMWILLIFHIAIPLSFLLLIYIHLVRVSRVKLIPPKAVTIFVIVFLIAFAIFNPVTMRMAANYSHVPFLEGPDWFYLFLFPLINENLTGTILLSGLIIFFLLIAVPKLKKKYKIDPAEVDLNNCNGCGICYKDCPYEAIQMEERSDKNTKYKYNALVSPKLCSGCGTCLGSCDHNAMNFTELKRSQIHKEVNTLLNENTTKDKWLGVFCHCNRGIIENNRLKNELAQLKIMTTPCVGLLGTSFIEEAEKSSAKGVVIGGCFEGDCHYREGNLTLKKRITGEKRPNFKRVNKNFPVHLIRFNPSDKKKAVEKIIFLIKGEKTPLNEHIKRFIGSVKKGRPIFHYSLTTIIFSLFLWIFYLGSVSSYTIPLDKSESIVRIDFFYRTSKKTLIDKKTLSSPEYKKVLAKEIKRLTGASHLEKIPKESQDRLKKLAEERAKKKMTGLERLPIQLEVYLDQKSQKPIFKKIFHPRGFRKDGMVYVYHKQKLKPGKHNIQIKAFEIKNGKKLHPFKPFKMEAQFKGGRVYFIDTSLNNLSKSHKAYLYLRKK